jgi:hypothetical protein
MAKYDTPKVIRGFVHQRDSGFSCYGNSKYSTPPLEAESGARVSVAASADGAADGDTPGLVL